MHIRNFTGKPIHSTICIGCLALLSTACQTFAESPITPPGSAAVATTMFSEADGVIPLEDRSRRKWDSPVIADLDQDGHLDLLLTEHGYYARLFWNNGGTFSDPYDVIMGDTHGVGAGDYDQDGRMDLIISRGGGDGSNPRNPVAFQVNRDRSIEGGEEFAHFERTRGRAVKLVDSDNDGSLDLVLSAFPLKSQIDGANHLYDNAGEGQFDFVCNLPHAQWMGFKVLVTDFTNHYDIGILSQNVSQNRSKGHVDKRLHSNLIKFFMHHFYRIFHCDNIFFRRGNLFEGGIERSRFSTSGRTRHQNDPVG